VAVPIDLQPVVSIRQEGDSAMLSLGSIVYFWRKRAQTAAFQPLQLPRHRNVDKFVFSAVWFRPK